MRPLAVGSIIIILKRYYFRIILKLKISLYKQLKIIKGIKKSKENNKKKQC